MMKNNIIHRRQFLKSTATNGIGLVVLPSGILSGANAPSNKISVACIGVRGRGNSVMNSFAAEPDCAVIRFSEAGAVNSSTTCRDFVSSPAAFLVS